MKSYPQLNLRLSQKLKEDLDYLAEELKIKDTIGAKPKIVRMAVTSLRFKIDILKEELGSEFDKILDLKTLDGDCK